MTLSRKHKLHFGRSDSVFSALIQLSHLNDLHYHSVNLKGNNSAGYTVLYQENNYIRANKIYHPALVSVKKERHIIIYNLKTPSLPLCHFLSR